MARPESIQWQHRRWLGDQKVLGMDWDAKAMHFHLLMMSIQEEPPGSIPDDTALIRRWLGSPSEEIWRRVKPQVFSAWTLRANRWFNQGMTETFERKERFSNRYEKGTKLGRASPEKQDNSPSNRVFELGSKKTNVAPNYEITPPDLNPLEYARKVLEEIGFPAANENLVAISQSIQAEVKLGKSKASAYEFVLAGTLDARAEGIEINRFFFTDAKYRPENRSKKRVNKREEAFEEARRRSREAD